MYVCAGIDIKKLTEVTNYKWGIKQEKYKTK
jgi:hypothetical protein